MDAFKEEINMLTRRQPYDARARVSDIVCHEQNIRIYCRDTRGEVRNLNGASIGYLH